MSGIIYIITTGGEGYVGSTNNFRSRMSEHKSNIYNKNSKNYNMKVYKKIRENNGQYEINIYEDNLPLNKTELRIREEEVRVLLGATLNGCRAHTSQEQRRQDQRYYDAKLIIRKSVPTKCECGSIVRYDTMSRHKKSDKHIRRMTSQEQNETVKHLQMSDAE